MPKDDENGLLHTGKKIEGDAEAEKLTREMVADGAGNGLSTEQSLLATIVNLYRSGKVSAAELRKAESTYNEIAAEAGQEVGQDPRQDKKSSAVDSIKLLNTNEKGEGLISKKDLHEAEEISANMPKVPGGNQVG